MQKQISVNIEGITIKAPANMEKIHEITEEEIKKMDIVFSYYRKLGYQTNIYGKDHWKNPFKVVVLNEDKDILCKAINFYLADNPKVERLTSKYYLVTSEGYQA
jgi:hypothetical protein